MKRFILAAVLIVSCVAIASAQLPTLNFGGGGQGDTPLVACGAVGLDFTTACGTTQYLVILR